jgi:hypothetical protein
MVRSLIGGVILVAASAPLFHFTFQSSPGFRIQLGGADEAYRAGAWGVDYEDQGPFRIRRGVRWMTHFQARMAHDGAHIRIPSVVSGGDAALRLRAHRYGQPGVVRLFASGLLLGSLVFEEDSYPWDVRSVPISRTLLERGVLDVELVREEVQGDVDLPPGAICALDWVELAPADGEAALRPSPGQWLFALGIPLLVLATLRVSGGGLGLSFGAAALASAAIAAAYARAPGSAAYAASRVWLAFPLGALVFVVLAKFAKLRQGSDEISRRLSAAFALVLLVSATVIFWPDHLPPDVRPHLRQIGRLSSMEWTREAFWEISSSFGKEGRTLSLGRPHPEADYVAPYSPWSYFLVHGLRKILDEPRFLVEYIAVVLGAALVVLVYGLTATLARATEAPAFAAALAALEVSIWHHASRAHTPALLGTVLLAAAILYLASRERDLSRPAVTLGFALLSLLATLSYPATLLHFVVLVAWLLLLSVVATRSLRGRALGLSLGSAAAMLGSIAIFYRRFLGSSGASAAFHPESYRAPASFFFLRNQPRDTVSILELGHPAFLALALPAYSRLRSWTSGDFPRRLVWAWTAAYLTFLVMKDPFFFPALLLQVKEDLFVAPLACALGGMSLAALAGKGRAGRFAAYALLGGLLVLRVNDYLYCADTIHPP